MVHTVITITISNNYYCSYRTTSIQGRATDILDLDTSIFRHTPINNKEGRIRGESVIIVWNMI